MPASRVTNLSRRGFSLIELLVAMSVLMLLVTMFGTFFTQASRAWNAGTGNAERRRSARAVTDFIAQELRGALLPVELKSNTGRGNLQFVLNPPEDQVPDQYRYADAMFWQAPLATEASYGDIAEVGYFVQWMNANTRDARPVLSRFFVNPSLLQDDGSVRPNPNFLVFDSNPKLWLSPSLISGVASGEPSAGYPGVFAENVLGFWVQLYGLDGRELPKNFDSRVGYECKFERAGASGYTQQWTERRYLPATASISLVQIDTNTAAQMSPVATDLQQLAQDPSVRDASDFMKSARERARSSGAFTKLLPGLRTYTTNVQLQNAQ